MDQELRRQIILDNYNNPSNKETVLDESYLKTNTNNSSCIDNIDLYTKIEDGIIRDIKFNGEACAISTASTSIMTTELIGKSVDEALKFINNFDAMINEGEYDKNVLNEAIVFDEIYKQANRKTCALLPYKGLLKALNEWKRENISKD